MRAKTIFFTIPLAICMFFCTSCQKSEGVIPPVSDENTSTEPDTNVPSAVSELSENEADKLREDFAKYISKSWPGVTADDIFIMGYYGTYNGNEVVIMYGTDYEMTDDEQEINVAGYTIYLPSGSLQLLLHKDSSFIDIRDAYHHGYLTEEDIISVKNYFDSE